MLGPGLTIVILKLTIPLIGKYNNFHSVKLILGLKAWGNKTKVIYATELITL